jgi:hypothetical protein
MNCKEFVRNQWSYNLWYYPSILVGRQEGKRPLGRPRRRWVDNIKINLREIRWDGIDCIGVAQDRDQCRVLVNMVTFGFHKMLGSSWVAARLAASQEWLSFVSKYVSIPEFAWRDWEKLRTTLVRIPPCLLWQSYKTHKHIPLTEFTAVNVEAGGNMQYRHHCAGGRPRGICPSGSGDCLALKRETR